MVTEDKKVAIEVAREEFDPCRAIEDLLTALEYGTKKEEADIISSILLSLKLKRYKKSALAKTIANGPGFEAFFFLLLNMIRPFSLMMVEIYKFLNFIKSTTYSRASKVLVRWERAKKELAFDLSNFPRELLEVLNHVDRFGILVELRFPGLELTDSVDKWDGSEAKKLWNAVSARWDGEFYDNGFHQLFSYAHTVLSNAEPKYRDRLKDVVTPIIDRLAAICFFVEGLKGVKSLAGRIVTSYMTKDAAKLIIDSLTATSHYINDPKAAQFLTAIRPLGSKLPNTQTMLEILDWDIQAFAITITIWNALTFRRYDKNDWFMKRMGVSMFDVEPEAYLSSIEQEARKYRRNLDAVAPVKGQYTQQELVKKLTEFLALPAWKDRWYLYELWTVIQVLSLGKELWNIQLNRLERHKDGTIEWRLPGGAASEPIAAIVGLDRKVLCWSQRKTYHPGSGVGLEPDLRLVADIPEYHDLVIVENKDRKTATKKYIDEILERYVDGTCAESIWLINYETFPNSVAQLVESWPKRRVHLISNFRPGSVPQTFSEEVSAVLGRYLSGSQEIEAELPAQQENIKELAAPGTKDQIEIILTWEDRPLDLDLHAWVINEEGTSHIMFSNKGNLNKPPYGELDNDHTKGGSGKETLRIKSKGLKRVVLGVHNYSNDSPILESRAAVMIQLPEQTSVVVHPPDKGEGRWWHVGVIDSERKAVEISSAIRDTEPTAESV